MIKYFCVTKRAVAITIVLALVCISFIGLCIGVSVAGTVTPNGMTIVIDPGHGGRDGGVVGTLTGEKEANVNLGISKSLRHFLTDAGYNVIMTRQSDVDLSSGDSGFKKSDMLARKKIIEEAKPNLVVSVHQNSFPDKEVHGAQVFYAPSSDVGKEIAETTQAVLNASLNCNRIAKSGDYYVIQCTEYPSMLVECGFLSNPTEEALLVTAEYQRKVAYAIYSSITQILEEKIA